MSRGRFAIYVIDTESSTVEGTNNVENVQELLKDDRYVVLMPQSGVYFHGSTNEQTVDELPSKEDEDDEDTDEEG